MITIKAKLSDLADQQPFTFDGKRYVKPPREERRFTKGNTIMFVLPGGVEVTENTEVELILDQKEFRKMESGQEFYDEHGLLHRRLNNDCSYIDESSRGYVNSLCYYDNELWGFGLHDPVFVVVKK